jgi:hypothetical protein
MLGDFELLKLTLGVCLLLLAWVVFAIWKEKFNAIKEEDRMNFLMFNIVGGSWLFAVFALCGGFYCILEPVFRSHL